MRIEGSIFRVFSVGFIRSVWTYLVIIGTLLTLALIPRNWYWIVPSGLCILIVFAAIRAVRLVRNEVLADAARQCKEVQSEATGQRDKLQGEIQELRAEISRLGEKIVARDAMIASLKVRPYHEAQLTTARSKLKAYSGAERDLLRFLLQRGETEGSVLYRCSQVGSEVCTHALDRLVLEGLIEMREDMSQANVYRPRYWRVNSGFEVVLRDLLFPRNESQVTPAFIP
jgi:hypothetical protein